MAPSRKRSNRTKPRASARQENPAGAMQLVARPIGPGYVGHTAEDLAARRMMLALKGPNNKYIQTTLAQGLVASAPTLTAPIVQCLNGVLQGTSENTRIGRLCKMKWTDINIQVFAVGAVNFGTVTGRFYILNETTVLGSNVTPTQFLLETTNFAPIAQRDRTNRNASRFDVLYDSGLWTLGQNSIASGQTAPVCTGAGQPAERNWSLHIPLGFTTDYSRANGGTIGDIDTNAVSIMFLTDAATAEYNINATWTTCFNDDS